MNVEAANDVDPKYQLKPRSIINLQVRVGDVWVGTVWACVLKFVWLQGQIHAGEWCYEVVGSCEARLSTSSQPDKTCMCARMCVICVCIINEANQLTS